jgi:hypothetical protein
MNEMKFQKARGCRSSELISGKRPSFLIPHQKKVLLTIKLSLNNSCDSNQPDQLMG